MDRNGIHSKVVVVGHVDHGKSTLLGRWLMDAGRVAADQVTKVESICAQKGISFEPAFLLDAFEEEQVQGISIDSTRAQVEFDGKKYLFIDVPGHHEFIKNMTSGASDADLGILMIDAAEGIQAQTRGHLQILSILNVPNVIVAINKMDKFGYDEKVFNKQKDLAEALLQSFGLKNCGIVPVSAIHGENVAQPSAEMAWYSGDCLLQAVSAASQKDSAASVNESFRMVLQDVYKFEDERYFLGRVESGELTPGKAVLFSPSGKASKVRSIARYPDMARAFAGIGESVAITLTEQIFVERGEIISFPQDAPEVGTTVDATLVWLSQEPLQHDAAYLLKIGTAETNCTVTVRQNDLSPECPVLNGTVVDVVIQTSQPVAFERTGSSGNLNRFVICTEHGTVAAGVIKLDQQSHVLRRGDQHVQIETGYIDRLEREQRQGHKAAVLWLTGLSGSGKSTLAKAMERELFDRNIRVVALDADTVRSGLCVDLGFTTTDRAENIRRIAEMAKVCMSTGAIVIVACISPYRKDRELARQIIGRDHFKEIYLSCAVEVCQSRDPKGLYKRVSQGQLKSFSGLDAPYQMPRNPSLSLDSAHMSVEESVSSTCKLLIDEAIIE